MELLASSVTVTVSDELRVHALIPLQLSSKYATLELGVSFGTNDGTATAASDYAPTTGMLIGLADVETT